MYKKKKHVIIHLMSIVNFDVVEKARLKKKLTPKQLAALLNITQSLYSSIKHGRRQFTLREVEILWRELEIPLNKLIIKQ